MRKKLNEEELADVIMQLVGEIEPVGETVEDGRRLDNLKLLTSTIDCLMDEIVWVSYECSRTEYSMKQCGEYATMWLKNSIIAIKECMGEVEP